MGAITAMRAGLMKGIMWANTHSPALLTAVGEGSLFLSVYSAIIGTKEYVRKYDNEKDERRRFGYPEMTTWEKVKMAAPYYIPTILFGATAGGCFLVNTIKEERKAAALMGLYSMTEKSFEEYKEKTKDLFGQKKEQRVRDEVDKKHIDENPVTNSQVIITGNGNYLCYESWSGRYFRSTIDDVKRANIRIRENLLNEMYVSLNEVWDELGLPQNNDGYDLGFTVDDRLEFLYSSQLADNGEPALVINFSPCPRPDYNKLY